jgi:predicted AAA+ superfamily ATPase
LNFWRTRAGSEVDFVVYGEDTFCAIEVKNASKVSPHDVRGLRTFQSDYPQADVALLYRGADRRRLGSVWCIPVQEFLPNLQPDKPIRFD